MLQGLSRDIFKNEPNQRLIGGYRASFLYPVGLTAGFHFIFPPLTIGLAWLIVFMKTMYLKTGNEDYWKISRFWVKIFAIGFVVGVATGIPMEFQFGTNWSAYQGMWRRIQRPSGLSHLHLLPSPAPGFACSGQPCLKEGGVSPWSWSVHDVGILIIVASSG
jgi:hypothetical protein